MKKLISLFVVFFALVVVGQAQKGVIAFKETTFNFGKIEQGKPVTHVFEFTNKGADPIIVTNATASCGCTTPTYTKEPVMPNKVGSISATFNAGVMGPFNKPVTVFSNAEGGSVQVTLTGEVVAAAEPAAATQTAATPAAAPVPAAVKEAKKAIKKTTKK